MSRHHPVAAPVAGRWPVPFATAPSDDSLGIVESIVEALPLALGILDGAGRLFQWNDAFRVTTGFPGLPGSRPARPELLLATPEDAPLLAAAITRVISEKAKPSTLRVRLAGRPEEPIDITLAPLPRGFGIAAAVLALRDIREQLRLEQQVAQVTRMQAVGQLAGGVAHDFNNILTAVLGLVDQALQRHRRGDPDHDDLEQIRLNAERAATLVRQLLAFARQQTLRPRSLDVNQAIIGVVPLLERLVGPTIDLRLRLGETLGAVLVDPGQLEQVIVNLAVNARDAMPEGGSLDIITRRIPAAGVGALGHRIMPAADYLEIAVCDTGTGIAPEIVGRIFEPFFTTKPLGQGTGLGLSTVYGIVKQTGGFVFVAPHASCGTAFTLYFPVTEAAAPDAVQPATPGAAAAPLNASVLLVEDDRAVRMVVERALARNGMQVAAAEDAQSALAILRARGRTIDLLISDVVMPGMDGVALVGAARALHPELPALLISGFAEQPQRRAASGPDVGFLAKPFAVADLIAAVRGALARVG